MNILNLVFILIFGNILIVYSQESEYKIIDKAKKIIIYDYIFWTDSSNVESLQIEPMALRIGAKYTDYISINKIINDSFAIANSHLDFNNPEHLALLAKKYGKEGRCVNFFADYTIIKNYPKKSNILMQDYMQHQFYRVYQKPEFDWHIDTKSDSTILGYNCKKATVKFAGRNYKAWFAPGIPISEGPYKFSGLPGLIMYIASNDGKHAFIAKAITNNLNKDIILTDPESGYKSVTPEEHVKLFKAYMQELFSNVLHEDKFKFFNEESKVSAIKNVININNFIEKYN